MQARRRLPRRRRAAQLPAALALHAHASRLALKRRTCALLQGGSFAYISPVFALAASIQGSMTFDSDHDRFIVSTRAAPAGKCRPGGREAPALPLTTSAVRACVLILGLCVPPPGRAVHDARAAGRHHRLCAHRPRPGPLRDLPLDAPVRRRPALPRPPALPALRAIARPDGDAARLSSTRQRRSSSPLALPTS